MQSRATTVEQYLAEQTLERRLGLRELLEAIHHGIQPGFIETMRWGMISFEVPLGLSGPTYNKEPLNYIGLASQKNHYSVYLMGVYLDPDLAVEFRDRWLRAGLSLDMGKGCIRFRDLSKADLTTITWAASLCKPEEFVELTHRVQGNRTRR